MKDFEIYIEIYQDMLEIVNASPMFKESQGVKAPEWMKSAVRKGQKIRDNQPSSNKCCEQTGLTRAGQILNGDNLSLSTIKRMKSFAARHGAGDLSNKESKRNQSLLIWGCPASKAGVDRFIGWCDAQINKLEKD